MCYNCGCGMPNDDMGDAGNITENTLLHLSEHWNKSLLDTKKEMVVLLQNDDPKLSEDPHLKEMFEKASKASNQSLEEAKKYTLELLKKEIGQA